MNSIAIVATVVTLIIGVCPAATAESGDDGATPAAKRYAELVQIYEERGRAAGVASLFLELSQKYPTDPVAIDALVWVLSNVRSGDAPKLAFDELKTEFIDRPRLGECCLELVDSRSPLAEGLLRAVKRESANRNVQAQASFALAAHLQLQLLIGKRFQTQPTMTRRFEQYYGRELSRRIQNLDPAKVGRGVETIYEKVHRDYRDVAPELAETALRRLFELRHLAIGKPAIDIQGGGIDGKEFKLSDYRGKVVALSFWGDWCGPCREQYSHHRALVKRLQNRPFVLLGVNSDQDRDQVKRIVEEQQLNWRSWWDGGIDGPIHQSWNIAARPAVFVIDSKGVIRFKNVLGEELDRAVDQLLREL